MWGCYKCLKCERYPLAKSGSIEQSPGCTNITHVAVVFVVVDDDDDDDDEVDDLGEGGSWRLNAGPAAV